jgi:serine/threonine protein kinase
MPAQEVEAWLRSSKVAITAGLELRPRAHPLAPGTPLSISRGQAEAFYTVANDKSQWIIKKFHPGRSPDARYLQAIPHLLPVPGGFKAGKERRILVTADLSGGYCPKSLADWLAGTVLMPKINGVDWAAITDKLRTGDLVFSREVRAQLCRSLAQAIGELEKHHCAHRDLSGGNVYINERTWEVSLIDWDSMYHPTLLMPTNTTCGSLGYIAPFVWSAGNIDPRVTWGEGVDRFALSICCVEFLVISRGSPFAGDGGMFDQDELIHRSGRAIDEALSTLRRDFSDAALLFERAINAKSYAECPAAEEWYQFTDSVLGVNVVPPRLDEIPWSDDDFLAFLSRLTPPAPVWPAPPLPNPVDFTDTTQQREPPKPPIHPAPPLPNPVDFTDTTQQREPPKPPIHPAPPLPDDPWSRRKS